MQMREYRGGGGEGGSDHPLQIQIFTNLQYKISKIFPWKT